MIARYEHTDTFAGEANYSWVKRGDVSYENKRELVKKVKSILGLTGVNCNRIDYCDMIVLKPRKICQIVFITFLN